MYTANRFQSLLCGPCSILIAIYTTPTDDGLEHIEFMYSAEDPENEGVVHSYLDMDEETVRRIALQTTTLLFKLQLTQMNNKDECGLQELTIACTSSCDHLPALYPLARTFL